MEDFDTMLKIGFIASKKRKFAEGITDTIKSFRGQKPIFYLAGYTGIYARVAGQCRFLQFPVKENLIPWIDKTREGKIETFYVEVDRSKPFNKIQWFQWFFDRFPLLQILLNIVGWYN